MYMGKEKHSQEQGDTPKKRGDTLRKKGDTLTQGEGMCKGQGGIPREGEHIKEKRRHTQKGRRNIYLKTAQLDLTMYPKFPYRHP